MDDAHAPPPEIRPHGKAGCKIGPGPAQAHLGLGETGGVKPVIPAESLKLCGRVAFRQIQHVPIAEAPGRLRKAQGGELGASQIRPGYDVGDEGRGHAFL